MSVLKWIWGLIRRFYSYLHRTLNFLVGVASSVVAWVVAGLAYVIHLVFQYVASFVEGIFQNLSEISLEGYPVSPLANWLLHDVIALDIAWECFLIYFAAWVATRIARSSFAAVRLILDIA